jgi:hypothetical protein
MSTSKIALLLGMKYPTVRAIVQMYKTTGCINKFLNRYEKKQLLKRR